MHVPRSGSRPLLTFLTLLLLALPWILTVSAEGSTGPSTRERQKQLRRIDKTVRRADARDAKLRVFGKQRWARADVRSLTLLDAALEESSRNRILERTRQFLERAAADGESSFVLELDRLSEDDRTELAHELGCFRHSPQGVSDEAKNGARDCILRLYREDASTLLEAQMSHFRQADGLVDLKTRLSEFRDSLRPSIKTRGRLRRKILGAPAFPAVWAWRKLHTAHDYEGAQWIGYGDRYRLFTPDLSVSTLGSGPSLDPQEARLLSRFAPILVQEVDPEAPYPAEVDRIGSFFLAVDGQQSEEPRPVVDPARPASYAYATRLPLHGRELIQLVYTFWYPEHPKLKSWIDVEAGDIEGITLRITLDASGEPRLYETIYNCGCFHRLFVDRELERAAAAEVGPPEGTRPFSIQREVDGKIDWIVPELVDFEPGRRPLLFVRAGFHLPASVRYELPEEFRSPSGGPEVEPVPYALRDYRELEHMPWNGGWTSVFTDKGLVRGAGRLEGIFLSPLGLYRAGQPRQRGTQLIHFDQADFDDPAIYDTYLRLPSTFFVTDAERRAGEASGRGLVTAGASPERETGAGTSGDVR